MLDEADQGSRVSAAALYPVFPCRRLTRRHQREEEKSLAKWLALLSGMTSLSHPNRELEELCDGLHSRIGSGLISMTFNPMSRLFVTRPFYSQ